MYQARKNKKIVKYFITSLEFYHLKATMNEKHFNVFMNTFITFKVDSDALPLKDAKYSRIHHSLKDKSTCDAHSNYTHCIQSLNLNNNIECVRRSLMSSRVDHWRNRELIIAKLNSKALWGIYDRKVLVLPPYNKIIDKNFKELKRGTLKWRIASYVLSKYPVNSVRDYINDPFKLRMR